MTTKEPILVLGANGKTGRRVARGCAPAACRCAPARARACRRSTGRTAPRGRPRCGARRPPTSPSTPTLPCRAPPTRSRRWRRWPSSTAWSASSCCRAAARSRRSAPSANAAGVRRRVDGRALQLVHAELQRGRLPRPAAGGRARPARRRGARAVRRRRRHRRGRRRGAHRGWARRSRLRADRPACAHLRRGGRRDRPRRRAGAALRPDPDGRLRVECGRRGPAARYREPPELPLHGGPRRRQRARRRRRPAGARARAARLRAVRERRRGDRDLAAGRWQRRSGEPGPAPPPCVAMHTSDRGAAAK